MPRLVDTQSRADTMTWGVNHLLALHGPTGVTIRALARATGISTGSLTHQYGNREHIMRVAAHRTARAREQRTWVEMRSRGVVAFLPRAREEELRDARVWLAWQEVHRSEVGTRAVLAEARERERGLVSVCLHRPLDDEEVREVHALVDGLLTAVCAPGATLDLTAAHRLLVARAAELSAPPLSPAG